MNFSFASCTNLGEGVNLLPLLKMYTFPSNKALCVVAILDCYIEKRSIWRAKNLASQILVSFRKLHNAVAEFRVAGCIN